MFKNKVYVIIFILSINIINSKIIDKLDYIYIPNPYEALSSESFNKGLNYYNQNVVTQITKSNVIYSEDPILLYEPNGESFQFTCSNFKFDLEEIQLSIVTALSLLPKYITDELILNPFYTMLGVDPNSPGSIIKFFYKQLSYTFCAVKTGAFVLPFQYSLSYISNKLDLDGQIKAKGEESGNETISKAYQEASGSKVDRTKLQGVDPKEQAQITANLEMKNALNDCVVTSMDNFQDILEHKVGIFTLMKQNEDEEKVSACEMVEKEKATNFLEGTQKALSAYNKAIKAMASGKINYIEGVSVVKMGTNIILNNKKLRQVISDKKILDNNLIEKLSNKRYGPEYVAYNVMKNILYYSTCFLTSKSTNEIVLNNLKPEICTTEAEIRGKTLNLLPKNNNIYDTDEKVIEKIEKELSKIDIYMLSLKRNLSSNDKNKYTLPINYYNRSSMLKEICSQVNVYKTDFDSTLEYKVISDRYVDTMIAKSFLSIFFDKNYLDNNIQLINYAKTIALIKENLCSNEQLKKIINTKDLDGKVKVVQKEILYKDKKEKQYEIGEVFVNNEIDIYKKVGGVDTKYVYHACFPYVKRKSDGKKDETKKDELNIQTWKETIVRTETANGYEYTSSFDTPMIKTLLDSDNDVLNFDIKNDIYDESKYDDGVKLSITYPTNILYDTSKYRLTTIEAKQDGTKSPYCVNIVDYCVKDKNTKKDNTSKNECDKTIEITQIDSNDRNIEFKDLDERDPEDSINQTNLYYIPSKNQFKDMMQNSIEDSIFELTKLLTVDLKTLSLQRKFYEENLHNGLYTNDIYDKSTKIYNKMKDSFMSNGFNFEIK